MTPDPQSELETTLLALKQQWKAITDSPEKPRSLMSVIEYGLGEHRRAEVYINRLLCYLLDPDEPHGMGTDFLEAVLHGLPSTCAFDEDTYDLSNVRVNQQVSVTKSATDGDSTDSTPGYVDLVIDVPNEWFLMIELKFSAPETGTEFYCAGSQIGDRPVEEYESGQYYLYLHQSTRPQAQGGCFANWTWQAFVEDVLAEFIIANSSRYPQRTVAQLHDLKDDLQKISSMNNHDDVDQQKIALYLDNYDAIEDVRTTFDTAWESYSQRWGEEVATTLEGTRVNAEFRPDDTVVTIPRAEDTERWILRATGGDWQHVFKHGWWKHEDGLANLETRADDTNDLRIGFYHRMGENSNRDTAVGDRELKFNFRCMGSNPTAFRDLYNEAFDEQTDEIEQSLAHTNGELTGHKRTLIEGTYDIRVDKHEGFFDAYTAALNEAFVDFVVENTDLIQVLSQTFDASIERYQ